MFDLHATWDALGQWGGFLQNHVPVDRWPNPVLWSGAAVLLGVALAFWGARILRSIYVLTFMVVGGAVGIRLAGVRQVDYLIGLLLGAGLAAVAAFIFFRWWVGLTTGLLAVLILVLAGSPRFNAELNDYMNFRLGVGTGDYSLQTARPPTLESMDQLGDFARDLLAYFMEHRQALVLKTGIGLGLIWLLGTLAGLLLPRLIMIIGTSICGVVLLAIGATILLRANWPNAWSSIVANQSWFFAGLAVLFLAALSYQARHRRGPIQHTAPLPAAA